VIEVRDVKKQANCRDGGQIEKKVKEKVKVKVEVKV